MLCLPPLSLYIHIPWCARKCPYCDFNSHAGEWRQHVDTYIAALNKDLRQDAHLAQGRCIESIFFGGGTPSLLPAAAIAEILDNVNAILTVERDAEITLETNPGAAEYSNFAQLKDSGITRLSFGAQSFSDQQLKNLGRIHSADEIKKAIFNSLDNGFENYNIDLMHSLPGQNLEDAIFDLESALALDPPHLSWYQLTIEPNTTFYSQRPTLPCEQIQADIFHAGRALLKKEGLDAYETSAYAKQSAESKHNLNYWRFGDYLAIGAGAHGKITLPEDDLIVRFQKTRIPDDYMDDNKQFTARRWHIEHAERPLEFMMNALRLSRGVASALFSQRTGLDISTIGSTRKHLEQRGLLINDSNQLRATQKGQLFLNSVLEEFM